jgi:hypothetical protein
MNTLYNPAFLVQYCSWKHLFYFFPHDWSIFAETREKLIDKLHSIYLKIQYKLLVLLWD